MNPTIYEVEPLDQLLHAQPLKEFASLRVAIVHYWFVGRGGRRACRRGYR